VEDGQEQRVGHEADCHDVAGQGLEADRDAVVVAGHHEGDDSQMARGLDADRHEVEVVVGGQEQREVDRIHDADEVEANVDADRQDAAISVAGQDWSVGHNAVAVARQEVDALVDRSTLLEVWMFLGWYASGVHEHPRGWWEGRVAQDYGEVK